MNKEIIKLSKISKKFSANEKDINVLKNINLKINAGELVSLTGHSGSGKSTLLHIIALLDKPTTGEIFFRNKNFSKSSEKEKDSIRKKGISIIYQNHNLLSDFSIRKCNDATTKYWVFLERCIKQGNENFNFS